MTANWGLEAHPSLGLEGSVLSWAGQGWACWTEEAYPACQCLANTENVAHGGAGPLALFHPRSCPHVCGTHGGLGPGQTLKLVTELKVNVARCCLYGVYFLLQCLWVSLRPFSHKCRAQA